MKEMKCTATSAVNKPIRKERNKNILLYIQTKFLTKDQEMHNIMMNIFATEFNKFIFVFLLVLPGLKIKSTNEWFLLCRNFLRSSNIK